MLLIRDRLFTEPKPIRHPGSEASQPNILFGCSCISYRALRNSSLSSEATVQRAQSAVCRNCNNRCGRKSSLCKVSIAKCRTAIVSRKTAYFVWRHAEKIRQFLVFCRYSSSRRTGCSSERSLRQDAE